MSDDKKIKLSTASSLRAFLSEVIAEGVKSALHQKALTEKEKQSQFGGDASDGDVDDLFGGDSGDDEGGDEKQDTSSKTMDDEKEKLEQGDIEPKDIVDKLNSIRSGKSFKDEKVSAAMEEYIGSLSKAEKVALLAFTRGIAQIVTGEVAGNSAEEPSDNPSDVKMEKGNEKDVHHVRPNVIKGGGGSKKPSKKQGPPEEDTSSPTPITPKRR
jgi:hypothetical protein